MTSAASYSGVASSPDNRCHGPASGAFTWGADTLVLNFGYYYGGYGRQAGCYTELVSGTLTE
jgi:hypothetical protein